MVAITVILAAVIGAFVLEIGDQQETAPNTSFDSEEQSVFIDSDFKANVSQVQLSHAGGDVVDITQTRVSVSGSRGAWGFAPNQDLTDFRQPVGEPAPDVRTTFGTNKQTEFSSGQTWNVVAASERDPSEYVTNTDYDLRTIPMGEWGGSSTCCGGITVDVGRFWLQGELQTDSSGNTIWPSPSLKESGGSRDGRALPILDQGETVRVVWTASSGGKTQTLYKYTVQSGSPDF
jgi:FlaG/FlaF family flagellin (archaellin)